MDQYAAEFLIQRGNRAYITEEHRECVGAMTRLRLIREDIMDNNIILSIRDVKVFRLRKDDAAALYRRI